MSDSGKDDVDRSSGHVGDDRLGEILHRVVPDGPDPTGRAEGVVRRGRAANRRRGAGGVLAVGLVALAVVIGPNVLDTGGTSKQAVPGAQHRQVPLGVTRLADPYTCPPSGSGDRAATPPPTDAVPPGAVLARLCPMSGKLFQLWSAPEDALWMNIDQLAAVYNGLPKGRPLPCPGTPYDSLGFTVTFQYPDGHLVRTGATEAGTGECDVVSLVGRGDVGRALSAELMSAFLADLQHQRADSSPPASVDPLTCPTHFWRRVPSLAVAPSLIPPDPNLDMTTAVICRYSDVLGEGIPPRAGTLTESQVRAVNASYREGLTTGTTGLGCMNPLPLTTAIIGRTAWGDTVALSTWCTAWSRSQPGLSRQMYWTPSRSLADSLFARLHS